jgi:two-component system KDP operon response regulator KdpE
MRARALPRRAVCVSFGRDFFTGKITANIPTAHRCCANGVGGVCRSGGASLNSIRHENKSAGRVALAVSGDAALLQEVREALEAGSLQVLVLDTAAEAPARAKARQPFLLLIDGDRINAPTADGTRVLEALKNSPYTSTVPVAVLLPRGAGEEAQLDAFRRGADECIARPESSDLFRQRLQAIAHRYSAPEEFTDNLDIEGLSLDLRSRKVSVNNNLVALTRKEFDLLNMLLRKRGIVVYTTHLYHSVWGYGESSPVDSHTVKVHISSLRNKLGANLGRKIVNLPGLGYRFDS